MRCISSNIVVVEVQLICYTLKVCVCSFSNSASRAQARPCHRWHIRL